MQHDGDCDAGGTHDDVGGSCRSRQTAAGTLQLCATEQGLRAAALVGALVVVGAAVAIVVLRGGESSADDRRCRRQPSHRADPARQRQFRTCRRRSCAAAGLRRRLPRRSLRSRNLRTQSRWKLPATVPAKVAISIDSQLPGAQVFVGKEKQPRGETPYVLELAKDSEPVDVKLVEKGFVSKKTKVTTGEDARLSLKLDKVRAVTSGSTTSGDSDDTMNPFAKKK